jgi:hypothetical protein
MIAGRSGGSARPAMVSSAEGTAFHSTFAQSNFAETLISVPA